MSNETILKLLDNPETKQAATLAVDSMGLARDAWLAIQRDLDRAMQAENPRQRANNLTTVLARLDEFGDTQESLKATLRKCALECPALNPHVSMSAKNPGAIWDEFVQAKRGNSLVSKAKAELRKLRKQLTDSVKSAKSRPAPETGHVLLALEVEQYPAGALIDSMLEKSVLIPPYQRHNEDPDHNDHPWPLSNQIALRESVKHGMPIGVLTMIQENGLDELADGASRMRVLLKWCKELEKAIPAEVLEGMYAGTLSYEQIEDADTQAKVRALAEIRDYPVFCMVYRAAEGGNIPAPQKLEIFYNMQQGVALTLGEQLVLCGLDKIAALDNLLETAGWKHTIGKLYGNKRRQGRLLAAKMVARAIGDISFTSEKDYTIGVLKHADQELFDEAVLYVERAVNILNEYAGESFCVETEDGKEVVNCYLAEAVAGTVAKRLLAEGALNPNKLKAGLFTLRADTEFMAACVRNDASEIKPAGKGGFDLRTEKCEAVL